MPLTPLRVMPFVAESVLVRLPPVKVTLLILMPTKAGTPLPAIALLVKVIAPVGFSSKTPASLKLVT